MVRFFNFILLLVLSVQLSAQKIMPSSKDFGKVKLWNNPIVTFQFINTSGKELLFLPIGYKQNYRISLPVKKIPPGGFAEIKFQYYTEDLGRFNLRVPIYISTQGDPIYLNLSGFIQTLHPDALTVCPSVDEPIANIAREQYVFVVDEETGERLDHFNILITGRDQTMAFHSGRKDYLKLKEIPINLYHFEAIKEGYISTNRTIYSGRNTTEIIIPVRRDSTHQQPEEEIVPEEEVVIVSLPPDIPEVADVPEEKNHQPPKEESKKETLEEKFQANREEIKRRLEESRKRKEEAGKDTPEPPIEEEKEVLVVEETVQPPPPEYDKMQDYSEDGRLNRDKYTTNNIVFLIDISGSMKSATKLPLLKEAMKSMVSVLRSDDNVSIITYSTKSEIVLSSIPGNQKELIYRVIDSLKAKGQSYGAEGMDMAYKQAKEHFIVGGNNEVILASDGLFNSPDFSEKRLYRFVRRSAQEDDVILSAIAFGHSSKADAFMRNLSQNGQGDYLKIKALTDAKSVLIRNIQEHSYKGK